MDYLEKEFGIKEGQSYQIAYENDMRDKYYIKKGLIVNFTPQQIVVKSDKGLHIFKPRYITEMKPLDKLSIFEGDINVLCESLDKTGLLDESKTQDILQKVGVSIYYNNGEKKTLYDILSDLAKAFKNMDNDEYKHTKLNIKDNVCTVLVGLQNKNKLISVLDKLKS
jgi:hypothetical protein